MMWRKTRTLRAVLVTITIYSAENYIMDTIVHNAGEKRSWFDGSHTNMCRFTFRHNDLSMQSVVCALESFQTF